MAGKFQLPNLTHRLTINGRNGTGKTQFAAWTLSRAAFDVQPLIIVDYKHDELLNSIDRAKEIGVHEKLPRHPGLYIMHPRPDDEAIVERWMWKVWERGKTGLMFDEGYMIPNPHNGNGAFKALLTQGRALKIPITTLTQRPSCVNRFAFSEANFYCLFELNDTRDMKTVEQFTPKNNAVWDLTKDLPSFHSRWYDISQNYSCILKPAPKAEIILEDIDVRLKPKRRWI